MIVPRFVAYKITNTVSGKAYIGLTGRSLRSRWLQHQSAARCGSSVVLHRAIRKYGAEAFSIEQVASSRTFEGLCETERLLIHQHDTFSPKGYNLTRGGEGLLGVTPSANVRARAREVGRANRGRRWTEEQRVNLVAVRVAGRATNSARNGVGIVTYDGVEYPSLAALAQSYGRSNEWATTRLRNGAAVSASGRVGRRRAKTSRPVILAGVVYPSIRACSQQARHSQRVVYRMLETGQATFAEI